MPGFTIPGAANIQRAGANLTSQAGRIATQTAGNLGNIQLQIARAKAAGITEGSRAFSEMLNRLGVTAQQYPIIKQQMEERTLRTQNLQQTSDLRGLQLEQAENRKRQLEVTAQVAASGLTDPEKIQGEFARLGHPEFGADFIKTITDAETAILNRDKAAQAIEIANNAARSQALALYVTKEEWGSAEEKRAAYQRALKDAAKHGLDVGSFGPDPTPVEDDRLTEVWLGGLSLDQQLKVSAKATELSAKGKERREFVARFIADNGLPQNAVSERKANRAFDESKLGTRLITTTNARGEKVQKIVPDVPGEFSAPADKPTAPPTKTLVGPDGKRHIFERNPVTGVYDRDLGLADKPETPTAAPGTRGYLARAAKRLGLNSAEDLTQEQENALLAEEAEAKRKGTEPILPPLKGEYSEGDTLYESVSFLTTSVLSNFVAGVGEFTGLFPETNRARQRFAQSQLNLIEAFRQSQRFPEGEAERIQKRISVDPSFFTAPSALRARMEEVDTLLRLKLEEAEALKEPKTARAIQRYLTVLGVPQRRPDVSVGGQFKVTAGEKTYTFPSKEEADAFKKEAGIQ